MTSATNVDYKICSKTIMDTSDPNITFDQHGVSDYYHNFHLNIRPNWHTGERGAAQLRKIADEVKREAQGRDFDCIIGLSGFAGVSHQQCSAYKEMLCERPRKFPGGNSHTQYFHELLLSNQPAS